MKPKKRKAQLQKRIKDYETNIVSNPKVDSRGFKKPGSNNK